MPIQLVPLQGSMYRQFYYDKEYMLRWYLAAARQKAICAGSHYCKFLDNTCEKTFIKYDNGVEEIRLVTSDAQVVWRECLHQFLIIYQHGRQMAPDWHYHTEANLPQEYMQRCFQERSG